MGFDSSSNSYNPYMYLAGVVSLGPTKCGTAGYPGNILLLFCFRMLLSIKLKYSLFLFIYLFLHYIQVYTR